MKIFRLKATLLAFVFLATSVFTLSAQEKKIRGVVSGESGPLIGATIQLKADPAKGTITDFDGGFELMTDPADELNVSYVGYRSYSFIPGQQTEFTIVLTQESSFLDEVVVVGYGNQKRSDISGAVGVVTAEEIKKVPALRIEQAIQGRTAGVQITQTSGSPGSSLSVRIRGTGTINNSDPLYVVDGVIVEGLDFLNPNDVQSISILKDAASAAIYGARAANGVVLITTKSGTKAENGTISFETYYGNQSVFRTLDLLNAREYAAIWNEAYINAGRQPLTNLRDISIFNQGTDWQKALFNSAPIMSNQITLRTSGQNYNASLSANTFRQQGIIGKQKSAFARETARFLFDFKPKEKLSLGANIGFTHLVRNGLPENSEFVSPVIFATNIDPLTPVYKPDNTFAYSDYIDTDIKNPLAAIEFTNDRWTSYRLVGNTYAQFDITKALILRSNFSTDITFANQKGFIPRYDLSVDKYDSPGTQNINRVNSVSFNNNTWRTWQWENTLKYGFKTGEHNVDILGGMSAIDGVHMYNGGANTNLPSNKFEDAFLANTIDPISSQSAYEGISEFSFLSYFAKSDYSFRERYLATASFRRDGSSKFGPNNRFGNFFSFSGGWIVSQEDFFKMDPISFLKLRASWGQNGNDRIGNYGYTSIVNTGQNYVFGPNQTITNGSVPLTISNPDLKWETVTQFDVGFDMELWDGKLNFTTDYYIKNTDNMLYVAPLPSAVGAFSPVRNIGKVSNKGLELAMQYRTSLGAVKFDVSGNVSFVNNKVVFLGGGDPAISGYTFVSGPVSRTDIGQPVASFYGFVTDGIFQNQAEIEQHAVQSTQTRPGDIRFKDLNGDNIIDDRDKTWIGNPNPDAIYGGTLRIAYKDLDVSAFLQGVYGNEIFNASVRYDKIGSNRPSSILNRWTGEGTSDSEPRVSLTDPNNNVRVSDRFIEDGSYLKIRNVQIGYDLASVLKTLKLTKCRVYVSGQNLWTFTRYSGYDPEIGPTGALDIGIDRGFYPQSRTILGGLQVEF